MHKLTQPGSHINTDVKLVTMGQGKTLYIRIPKWWRDLYDPDLEATAFLDYLNHSMHIIITGKLEKPRPVDTTGLKGGH